MEKFIDNIFVAIIFFISGYATSNIINEETTAAPPFIVTNVYPYFDSDTETYIRYEAIDKNGNTFFFAEMLSDLRSHRYYAGDTIK